MDIKEERRARLIKMRKRQRRSRRIWMSVYTVFIASITSIIMMAGISMTGHTIVNKEDITPVFMSNVVYATPVVENIPTDKDKIASINSIPPITEIPEPIEPPKPVAYINPSAKPNGEPLDKYYGWSENDYKRLLQVIVGESHGCSREEQMATGSVVLNRLYNDKYFSYADSIEDVVLARGQYSCFSDGNAYRKPTETNKEVVLELLKNGPILPSNCIFQSMFMQGDGLYKQFPTGTKICYKD